MKPILSKVCPCCLKKFIRDRHKISNKQWEKVIWCSGKCREQEVPIEQYRQKRLGEIFSNTVTTKSGCIEWQGGFRNGYPLIKLFGKQESGGRIVWRLINKEIPNGLWVLHKCDNKKCININHLFLGTQQDNNRDRDEKGRTFRKITDDQKIKIIQMAKEGIPYRIIAEKIGTRPMTACLIAKKNGIHRR